MAGLTDFRRQVLEALEHEPKYAVDLGAEIWPDMPVRSVEGGGADSRTSRMSMQLGRMERGTRPDPWIRQEMLPGAGCRKWYSTAAGRRALEEARVRCPDCRGKGKIRSGMTGWRTCRTCRGDGELGDIPHTCHWPGCGVEVPPKLWGCKKHWFALPKALRDRIWATYRPGQEIDKRPSAAYVEAARAVQEWIATSPLRKCKHPHPTHLVGADLCRLCGRYGLLRRPRVKVRPTSRPLVTRHRRGLSWLQRWTRVIIRL